jgi:hypothetical protein
MVRSEESMPEVSNIQVSVDDGDSQGFIKVIDQITDGIVRQYVPAGLVMIKIDQWFGSRWLGFSGKAMGALGVWKARLTIPPFVPNRVLTQRRYSAPLYEEVDSGRPVHVDATSGQAMARYVASVEPETALIWYSGESQIAKRGSVMAYVPAEGGYIAWYASWVNEADWKMVEVEGISRVELDFVREKGSNV